MGNKVEYCLSEKVDQHCKLNFSVSIAAIVILINAIKVIFIGITAFGMKETPILNMGDAVTSFLSEPDPETKDMCLITKDEIINSKRKWPRRPKTFRQKKHRWYKAASTLRWSANLTLFVTPPPQS